MDAKKSSLMTIDEFMTLEIVSPFVRGQIAAGLRGGWVRGYKLGKRWYVVPKEVVQDLKQKGTNQISERRQHRKHAMD